MYKHVNPVQVECRRLPRCQGCNDLIKRRSEAKHVRENQARDTAYRENQRWLDF